MLSQVSCPVSYALAVIGARASAAMIDVWFRLMRFIDRSPVGNYSNLRRWEPQRACQSSPSLSTLKRNGEGSSAEVRREQELLAQCKACCFGAVGARVSQYGLRRVFPQEARAATRRLLRQPLQSRRHVRAW